MLTGKKIFITGSSRGIGAAIAVLAKEKYGAKVIIHGSESRELRNLAGGLSAPYLAFDVSDEEAVEREVGQFGNIDVLVNNAGINPSKTFLNLSNVDWRRIFDVNLFGVVNVSRAVLKGMVDRKCGSIVNIASIKGHSHVSGKPAYASAKAAVIRLTSSMAEEFAPHGIRVNAVAPGFTDTELTKSTLSPQIQAQIDRIPLQRMATLEEIAEAVLFLASDKASYITGQCLNVDGGLSIV